MSIKKMAARVSRKKVQTERERRENNGRGKGETDAPFLTVVTIPTKTAFVRWTSNVMQTSPRYVSVQDNCETNINK